MLRDLVIGIDSSTQSTKAIAWSMDGSVEAEGRASIELSMPQPGWAEQSVENWWSSCCAALKELTSKIDTSRIAGVAISNQRETVAFVDASGSEVRPAIVWLDERAGAEVREFSERFGVEKLHRTTGKNPDITQVVYRLEWLRRNEDTLARSHKIVDVQSFLVSRLTGKYTTSSASADPFGIFDLEEKAWSGAILDTLGIRADQLSEIVAPGTLIGSVTESAAEQTGLPGGIEVYAGAGDGQCAGLGVNAARSGHAYLSLGTAIITGVYARDPLIGRSWNTLTSPTGDGYFLEAAQRAGAFFINWFFNTFTNGETPEKFERQAVDIPIGSEGLMACTYLNGCMPPHWDAGAKASFVGIGPNHNLGHFYRASLEAMTLEIARCLQAMRSQGLVFEGITVVGGGSNSAIWPQFIADATGLPVRVSKSAEASSLGAGICAAVGAGLHASFESAAEAMCSTGAEYLPNAEFFEDWQALSVRQAQVYRPTKLALASSD